MKGRSKPTKGPATLSAPTTQTMAFTEERLRELATRPAHTVYTYEYATPDATMAPEAAKDVFVAICQNFDAGCRKLRGASDEALREAVLKQVPQARLFQHLYASVFARATVRARTSAEEETVDRYRKMTGVMLMTRCEHKEATEEQKASQAMQWALRFAMKPATGDVPEDAVSLDSQLAAAGMDPSEATPVGRFDLGPSTVNQS